LRAWVREKDANFEHKLLANNNNINSNITNDNVYSAVIYRQSHCESSVGSRDEYST